ncbi:MAG: hypothetical protein AAF602_01630 [Myxococcota bacterium]
MLGLAMMGMVMVEASAGPAWVVQPLAPAAGVRFGDRAQLDVLLQPVASWRRLRSEAEAESSSLGPVFESRVVRLGAAIDVVGRLGLSDAPSRAVWSVGVEGSWQGTRDLEREGSSFDRTLSATLWSGPGFAVAIARRWSLGADLQLVSGTVGDAGVSGFTSLLATSVTRQTSELSVGLLTGAQLWIAFRPDG